jgi:DNA-binding NtrC family response regulator
MKRREFLQGSAAGITYVLGAEFCQFLAPCEARGNIRGGGIDIDEALEILDREDVGVLVLDLNLFGMNGIELGRKIRRERPLCILYAMTGWTGLFEVEECREAGFDDFFTKPLSIDFVYRVVDDAFEKLARWRRGYPRGVR